MVREWYIVKCRQVKLIELYFSARGQDLKVSDKNVVRKSSHVTSDEESAKVSAKKKDYGTRKRVKNNKRRRFMKLFL